MLEFLTRRDDRHSDHKGVLKKYFQQYHVCYYEFQDTTVQLQSVIEFATSITIALIMFVRMAFCI